MPHSPDRRLACFTHFVVEGLSNVGKSSLARTLGKYLGADWLLAGAGCKFDASAKAAPNLRSTPR